MIIIKSTNFTDGESGDFALKMVPWSQVGRVRFYSDVPRYQSLKKYVSRNDADDTFAKASEFLVSIRFISRGNMHLFFWKNM